LFTRTTVVLNTGQQFHSVSKSDQLGGDQRKLHVYLLTLLVYSHTFTLGEG